MEISGKIKEIQQVVEKANFKSRNVIVTTDEQYPQQISVQFVQDKCEILDKYVVGQSVKVSINLRGREWVNPEGESVYFNTLQGWRIEKVEGENVPDTKTENMAPTTKQELAPKQPDGQVPDLQDDLPF